MLTGEGLKKLIQKNVLNKRENDVNGSKHEMIQQNIFFISSLYDPTTMSNKQTLVFVIVEKGFDI